MPGAGITDRKGGMEPRHSMGLDVGWRFATGRAAIASVVEHHAEDDIAGFLYRRCKRVVLLGGLREGNVESDDLGARRVKLLEERDVNISGPGPPFGLGIQRAPVDSDDGDLRAGSAITAHRVPQVLNAQLQRLAETEYHEDDGERASSGCNLCGATRRSRLPVEKEPSVAAHPSKPGNHGEAPRF